MIHNLHIFEKSSPWFLKIPKLELELFVVVFQLPPHLEISPIFLFFFQ